MYTAMWHACVKGMCALLSSCRIQLTFNILLGQFLHIPQVSVSCSGLLISTQNCSLAAGLFLRFLGGGGGGGWIPIAESPFQLSALECVQTVKIVYSITGSLAPLWDSNRNADKRDAQEKPRGSRQRITKVTHDQCLVTGQLAVTLLCIYQSLESRDFSFSLILLAPVRKAKGVSIFFKKKTDLTWFSINTRCLWSGF